MTNSEQKQAHPPAALMHELKFDANDLAANRDGQLSQRQRDYLELDRRKNAIVGGAVVVALVLASGVMLFIGFVNENLILQGLAMVLIVCNTAATTLFSLEYLKMRSDLRTDGIDVVEGEAQHVVRQLGRAQAGSIRVGEVVEIPTDDVETFKAFEPGAQYRLYRTARTHRLLSVERIEDGQQ